MEKPAEVLRPQVALLHDEARREPFERGSRPEGRDDSRVEADGVAEGHAAGRDGPAGDSVRWQVGQPSCGRSAHAGGRAACGVEAVADECRVAVDCDAGAEQEEGTFEDPEEAE